MIQEMLNEFLKLNSDIFPTSSLKKSEQDYLYNIGVQQMQSGKYSDAVDIFRVLTSCEINNIMYLKALAGALHANKEYVEACLSYQCIYLLDQVNQGDCLLYSGVCLYHIKKMDVAEQFLSKFLTLENQAKKLITKAKLYLQLINSKPQEEK